MKRYQYRSALFVAAALLLSGCCEDQTDEIDRLRSENEELRTALTEANEHLSEAASAVQDVRGYAYRDCGSLRFAAQSMDEPEQVAEP